ASAIDWSNGTTLTAKVWSPEAGTPFLLKIEDLTDPMNIVSAEVLANSVAANTWETISFDMTASTVGTFDPAINYTQVIIFPNYDVAGTGTTFYADDIAHFAPAITLPTLPITFEDPAITYQNLPFGELVSSVIANPDASGDNTSATVLSLEKVAGAQTWAGATLPLASAIDWSNGTTLTAKVWSPNAGTPFLLKIEDVSDPMNIVSAEVLANSTSANTWETISFDMTTSTVGTFDPAINYTQVIIFPDFDNAGTGTTFYADDVAHSSVQVTLPTLPITFEDGTITYTNNAFGDSNSSVIPNPDPSGANTSATVLSFEKPASAQVWAGTSLPLEAPIDWSLQAGNILSVKVWSPRAGVPVLLKIENAASMGATFAQVLANTTTANAWETIIFDMGTASDPALDPSVDYDLVALFADFENPGMDETFYFDDIMNDVDVAISDLDKAKVVVNTFPNPVDQVVNINFSIPVSGNITFTLVDILGRNAQEVNEGKLYEGNYQTVIDVNGLNSGVYYLVTRLDGEIISTKNIMKK
ncbi:MAG: T9SS type A sorting domain-containing protein, partial [Saprospiraceae bacterium]